ncbi:unnamed protein product [Parascedosporium putredinis]|uniref:SET domain-containing protein n=1 Tax=Parascedosporium putredinis TaxID=1442378 RepID=A0A9P1GY02_9PEZI|nr:unnamed protein product [Parascedosporium putredinis]CAI7989495.1 unnamed protein product [Parascedosporium putredinis]
MEDDMRKHFFRHGDSDPSLYTEKRNCHLCQIRSFPTHEDYPITVINEVDDEPLPFDFRFINEVVLGEGVEPAEDSFRSGCECRKDELCQFSECQCLGDVEDSDSTRTAPRGKIADYRSTRTRPRTRPTSVEESRIAQRKDVYLFALDKFNDPDSLDPRLSQPALLVDGEFMSGPTRFINHSCEPNLRIYARVGDHADKHLHDLALFAITDIKRNTELTFDYIDGVEEDEDDLSNPERLKEMAKLTEEVLHESIDARTESLITLRELGPRILSISSSMPFETRTNSCYNAFSRLDMRVHVTIPGSVEAYCVDERGEQKPATEELWLETYLCSVLRAYSYADDGSGETIRKIMGVRRFNPVTNTESEHRFLNAAEQLFFKGWQLGSDSIVQVPSNVANHLTTGLLRYFETTGRYASGINLFEKLRTQNIEVSSLLAKILFMGNEEVRGVRILHEALKETPMDYSMLDTQAEFLLKKAQTAPTPEQRDERLRLALGCADRSTVAAPSEFRTWARLAEVYVAMEDWEHALAVLNSCPMFTYQDKDAPIMPEPKDVYLPTLAATRLDEIDSEPESRYSEQVDPNLLNLRAASYKGTFRLAYNILTEMTAKLGWDQLLRIRSNVFVMEDEYRNEKQDQPAKQATQLDARNPSTDGLRGSRSSANGDDSGSDSDSDSEVDANKEEAVDAPKTNGDSSPEKPSNTIDPDVVKADAEQAESSEQALSKLNNKRLCERWLDSLFMVLYEDLRALAGILRALERRGRSSWDPHAAVAARSAARAANPAPNTNSTRDTVAAVIRLITWQYRWYSEFSPELLHTIRALIEDEGALKIRSIIQATSLPQNVLDLTHHYAALCATFRAAARTARPSILPSNLGISERSKRGWPRRFISSPK